MFEEDRFQTVVALLSNPKIVKRVEIEQRHGFNPAAHRQGIALNNLNSQVRRLLRPVGVDFNSIEIRKSISQLRRRTV